MQTSAKPNEHLHKEENKSTHADKKKNNTKATTNMVARAADK